MGCQVFLPLFCILMQGPLPPGECREGMRASSLARATWQKPWKQNKAN